MPRRIGNGRPGGFVPLGGGKARLAKAAGRLRAAASALVLTSPAEEGRRYLVTEVVKLGGTSGGEDARVDAEQLAGVDGADERLAVGALGTSDVADVQRRPRLVGRVGVRRVGQDERLGEVGVRAGDERNVIRSEEHTS